MRICSTSVRKDTVPIESIGVANCNDQIAARAFGAVRHIGGNDFNGMSAHDLVFATMSKVWTPEFEPRWMDNLHRLKDETNTKVVLFQEAETAWPTTRPWEEQRSFIQLLGKVDLFLTHNVRDIDMWGALRGGLPTARWRTCLDLSWPNAYRMLPSAKIDRPVLFGSSYDQRANGLAGLIACKDLGRPLWHQNRSTGYVDRNAEIPGLVGVDISKEIPHSNWSNWMEECSGAYLAVHPMPAAAAGRDQICFAAMGIPCIGNEELDIQRDLFPRLCVNPFDVYSMKRIAKRILEDVEEYAFVREFASRRVSGYGLDYAQEQARTICVRMGWI